MNKKCRSCERVALDGHDYCTVCLQVKECLDSNGSAVNVIGYQTLAVTKDTKTMNDGYRASKEAGKFVENLADNTFFGEVAGALVEGTGRAITDVNATVVQTGKNIAHVGNYVADSVKEGVKSFFSMFK